MVQLETELPNVFAMVLKGMMATSRSASCVDNRPVDHPKAGLQGREGKTDSDTRKEDAKHQNVIKGGRSIPLLELRIRVQREERIDKSSKQMGPYINY